MQASMHAAPTTQGAGTWPYQTTQQQPMPAPQHAPHTSNEAEGRAGCSHRTRRTKTARCSLSRSRAVSAARLLWLAGGLGRTHPALLCPRITNLLLLPPAHATCMAPMPTPQHTSHTSNEAEGGAGCSQRTRRTKAARTCHMHGTWTSRRTTRLWCVRRSAACA